MHFSDSSCLPSSPSSPSSPPFYSSSSSSSSSLLQINRAPSFGTDQKIDYDVKKGVLLNALKLLNIRYCSVVPHDQTHTCTHSHTHNVKHAHTHTCTNFIKGPIKPYVQQTGESPIKPIIYYLRIYFSKCLRFKSILGNSSGWGGEKKNQKTLELLDSLHISFLMMCSGGV